MNEVKNTHLSQMSLGKGSTLDTTNCARKRPASGGTLTEQDRIRSADELLAEVGTGTHLPEVMLFMDVDFHFSAWGPTYFGVSYVGDGWNDKP